MKEITRINHLGLRVKQLDISRAFYEKLGFEFITGPVGPEPVAIMEHPSGVNINFILNADSDCAKNILMDTSAKNTGFTHVALEVTNYESALNEVKKLGIAITGEVEFEGAKFFFIRDPDRNVIEFHQPGARKSG
ncbi:VOC family protein [Marinobacter zhejiangensis]|uniref:Lactoylglutathione lyase n=1 Tax=Marinobacter zhejiangensis TaxID=488535 RepID=A0A1I4QB07_9GAMM|nr:VOC family protein [Marinobacter zhejiangensis]SFM37281.1 lactoylglutathione lyase [Marinobacter zhejiangensis]